MKKTNNDRSLLDNRGLRVLLSAAIGLLVGFAPAVLGNRALTRRQAPEFVILKHLA